MNFLNFLKQVDGKRLRTKRIVVYSIYLLAPVVIAATAFSNDRIITKCEEIKEQQLACADRLRNCGGSGSSLTNELDDLKKENQRLREAAPSTRSPTPSGELAKTRTQLEEYIHRNRELTNSLKSVERQLAEVSSSGKEPAFTPPVKTYLAEYQDTRKKFEDFKASTRQLVTRMNGRIATLQGEKSLYQKRYAAASDSLRAIMKYQRPDQKSPLSDGKKLWDIIRNELNTKGLNFEILDQKPGGSSKAYSIDGKVLQIKIGKKYYYFSG